MRNLDAEKEPRERQRIIFPVIQTGKNEKTATEKELVDTGADIIFLKEKWIYKMKIKMKKDLCEGIVQLADKTKKAL